MNAALQTRLSLSIIQTRTISRI